MPINKIKNAAIKKYKQRIVTAFILGPSLLLLINLGGIYFLSAIFFILLGMFVEVVDIMRKNRKHIIVDSVWLIMALASLLVVFSSLYYLRNYDDSGRVLVWFFLVIWAYDSFAMIAGKIIKGPKLAPRISPAKTWAGLFGGIVAAELVGFSADLILNIELGDPLLYSLILALSAQAGDLLESAFKRNYNVKDSGTILPGHGGLLDRFDTLFVAAPVMAFIF